MSVSLHKSFFQRCENIPTSGQNLYGLVLFGPLKILKRDTTYFTYTYI